MQIQNMNVWKRSVRLSVTLYKTLKYLDDQGFRDQITRAGLSVPSNIAEGLERNSSKECARFLYIAKASNAELRTQLHIGMEIGYVDRVKGQQLISEAVEISKMISGLIKCQNKNT